MAYQSIWVAKRDQILQIASQVKDTNPGAWAEIAILGQKSRAFINLVSIACIQAGIPAGVNLKRGGPEESIDVLAFPNASGCPDSTGTYPGLELIDIGLNAEGSNEGKTPSLTWNDVTQKTIDGGSRGGWKAGTLAPSQPQQPPAGNVLPKARAFEALKALDAFYRAPEGLQRENGIGGDMEAIAQWFYQLVIEGKTIDDVKAQIRQSDEWRVKHPA